MSMKIETYKQMEKRLFIMEVCLIVIAFILPIALILVMHYLLLKGVV